MSMTVQEIVDELNACEILRESIRRGAMIYQFDLKVEVAEHYRLTWEEVNLPYPQWETLRNRFLREKGRLAG